jgi:RHS repeat-associated protein
MTYCSGKERDSETGLDYFGARYMSSAQGRFTSPDEWAGGIVDAFTGLETEQPGPLPYADITDPQTLNKYAYVRNNPLRFTDPTGHCPWCIVLAPEALTATAWVAGAVGATGVAVVLQQNADKISGALGDAGRAITSIFTKSNSKPGPLPANPDALKDEGYHDTSHPDAAAAGHRTFENPQSGDRVRFDKGKPGAPGHEGTDHYHRPNPQATGKGDQYLDANGKPVPRGCDASQLKPQPPPPLKPKPEPNN